nr:uncharacterized mitochondrial protein AtMg00810-like [Tanacetum cinerariifolium]
METKKPLLKDEDGVEVDVTLCTCARFQVNPKISHLHAVKRIFRYLKGQPKLGLWYPKDSPFDLVAYTDRDYVGASLDRKSTTEGCQFLRCGLILWQCKKQTMVANSTTEAEYIDAFNCCGQLKVNAARHKLTTAIVVNAVEEQFWTTTKAKNINGEVLIHAKVDGRKVIIFEATIRRDLKFKDEGGVDCLSNEVIFEQFTLIGTVKHLDSRNKFLMYLRFVQVFLDEQVDGMSKYNAIYVIPYHTKKVFRNMKRVGKDFSRKETPLFPTMVVQAQEELGEGSANPNDPHPTPIITQPSTYKPQKKQKPRKSKRKDTQETQPSVHTINVADEALNEESVPTHSNDPLLSGQEIREEKEVKNSRAEEIVQGWFICKSESSNEESSGKEDASKQGRKIIDIDADKELTLVDETTEEQRRMNDQDEIMFDVNADLHVIGDITTAGIEETVSTAAPITIDVTLDDITLAKALEALKTSKPKIRGNIIRDHEKPSESRTTPIVSIQQPSQVKAKDKGKAKMIKEHVKLKTKEQIRLDEELEFKLQAEQQEEERIARDKA